LIHSFASLPNVQLRHLNKNEWDIAIASGVEFAADVCLSLDNYVSIEFALTKRS
jgi:hypothetical protein